MYDDDSIFGHDGRNKPPLTVLPPAKSCYDYHGRSKAKTQRNSGPHTKTLRWIIDLFDGIDALGGYMFYVGRYRIATFDYGMIGIDIFGENILIEPQGKYRTKIEQRLHDKGIAYQVIGAHRFLELSNI